MGQRDDSPHLQIPIDVGAHTWALSTVPGQSVNLPMDGNRLRGSVPLATALVLTCGEPL